MIISQIAAMSTNRVIGVNNSLPWHMPDDLAYFFRKTKGRHIIMGRKNYEANGTALKNRTNIVITRNENYSAPGCILVRSIPEALQFSEERGEEEVFIVGGGQIYAASLGLSDRIYLTTIHALIEGDVYFPELDPDEWNSVYEEKHQADKRNPYDFTYFVYERVTKSN